MAAASPSTVAVSSAASSSIRAPSTAPADNLHPPIHPVLRLGNEILRRHVVGLVYVPVDGGIVLPLGFRIDPDRPLPMRADERQCRVGGSDRRMEDSDNRP